MATRVLASRNPCSHCCAIYTPTQIDNVFLCSIRTPDGKHRFDDDGSLALIAKIGDMGLSRYVGGGRDSIPPWAEVECVGREKCCHLSPDVRLVSRRLTCVWYVC